MHSMKQGWIYCIVKCLTRKVMYVGGMREEWVWIWTVFLPSFVGRQMNSIDTPLLGHTSNIL